MLKKILRTLSIFLFAGCLFGGTIGCENPGGSDYREYKPQEQERPGPDFGEYEKQEPPSEPDYGDYEGQPQE